MTVSICGLLVAPNPHVGTTARVRSLHISCFLSKANFHTKVYFLRPPTPILFPWREAFEVTFSQLPQNFNNQSASWSKRATFYLCYCNVQGNQYKKFEEFHLWLRFPQSNHLFTSKRKPFVPSAIFKVLSGVWLAWYSRIYLYLSVAKSINKLIR